MTFYSRSHGIWKQICILFPKAIINVLVILIILIIIFIII